jgi:hypothetical protein
MSLAPRQFTDYAAGLKMCFEEEISGRAYFAGLAEFHRGTAREALALLAAMERVTGDAIRPLLDRHSIAAQDVAELAQMGRTEAAAKRDVSWADLVSSMASDFPAFVTEFEQIIALAPPQDRPVLHILVDHEVAAVEFAEREAAGRPDSLAPLRAFMATFGGAENSPEG